MRITRPRKSQPFCGSKCRILTLICFIFGGGTILMLAINLQAMVVFMPDVYPNMITSTRPAMIQNMLESAWEDLLAKSSSTSTANRPSSRVISNVVTRTLPTKADQITLITHVSVNKLEKMHLLQKLWGGLMSVAVWVRKREDIEEFHKFIQSLPLKATDQMTLRQGASFHIYMECSGPEHSKRQSGIPINKKLFPNLYLHHLYPHNILRNIAMDYSDTDYYVTNDVDMVPGPNTYRDLMRLFRTTLKRGAVRFNIKELLQQRSVMVLPVFERFLNTTSGKVVDEVTEEMLPQSKRDVIQMVKAKLMQPFHEHVHFNLQGSTDFPKWYRNQTGPFYRISFRDDFEPYVLGYKKGTPRNEEAFRGYGFNKQAWYYELDRAKYTFFTLRDFYYVHRNHKYVSMESKIAQQDFNRGEFNRFLNYLKNRYAAVGAQLPEPDHEPLPSIATTTSTTTNRAQQTSYQMDIMVPVYHRDDRLRVFTTNLGNAIKQYSNKKISLPRITLFRLLVTRFGAEQANSTSLQRELSFISGLPLQQIVMVPAERFSRARAVDVLHNAACHLETCLVSRLDVDMEVRQEFFQHAVEMVAQNYAPPGCGTCELIANPNSPDKVAYFPIVWSAYNPKSVALVEKHFAPSIVPEFTEHRGHWRVYGKGMYVISGSDVPLVSYNTSIEGWGGEDVDFYNRIAALRSIWRRYETGLIHTWHPKYCNDDADVMTDNQKEYCGYSMAKQEGSELGVSLLYANDPPLMKKILEDRLK